MDGPLIAASTLLGSSYRREGGRSPIARGHQVGMVGKVRVGRCRFACIHRPTDLVALVNQNEIPAKLIKLIIYQINIDNSIN